MRNEWVCDANEAIEIQLISKEQTHTFHPTMSYQIFDQELIYGYKDLKIVLSYCAGSLYSLLTLQYSKKTDNPQDVVQTLNRIIKQDTLSLDQFMKQVNVEFKPMGEKVYEYKQNDHLYEFYKCNFDTRKFKQFHDRIKGFLFWFIEGKLWLKRSFSNRRR
jgi:histone acetyltransferase 1